MPSTSNVSDISVSLLSPPQTWTWKGFSICYQAEGEAGPAVVLIHGFGASWQHWLKNIPALAGNCRVYAIDLIGFGSSAKPVPFTEVEYTPAYLVGNSIGCIVAMQTAVTYPDSVLGIAMLNCSLRLLHDRRRATLPWYRRMGAPLLQRVLAIRWLGHNFFRLIARPNTVRKILLKAYIRPEAVTDELVDMLMAPAADVGAADVFLAFTRYSQGPLPEDLLEVLPCPAILLWGTQDPWEPIALGRNLANFPAVQKFIPLEGVGHCPQDEAPELVNPILEEWVLSQVLDASR
jgi:pimeloyl-ACP methyl ester carboxylesterase